jgi:hypothetical protein
MNTPLNISPRPPLDIHERKIIADYLERLGYPGNWARADCAIHTIATKGFVVSSAAEDMIRKFGGLDTQEHRPPTMRNRTGAEHEPAVFCITPFHGVVSREDVDEMEVFHGVRDFCPIGFYYGLPGFMCIDPLGRVFFEESPFGYSGTPTEVIIRLLSGRPTLLSPGNDV